MKATAQATGRELGRVAMAKKRRAFAGRLEYWTRKITKRWSRKGVPAVAQWASHLLYALDRRSDRSVEAASMEALATAIRIPRKFVSRALAATNGLVSCDPGPPLRVVLHRKRLLRGKNVVDKTRGHNSRSLRALLFSKDGHRCGRCGKKFSSDQLEIDHLVPLALRGADQPGNWVALCRRDNREKRASFQYGFIRYYRGDPVRGAVGVRFRDGFFWPHVNGRIRTDRRRERNARV